MCGNNSKNPQNLINSVNLCSLAAMNSSSVVVCLQYIWNIRLFPKNLHGVSKKFQGCIMEVSSLSQGCFKGVSRGFQENVVEVALTVFQECFRMFQGYFNWSIKGVSREFLGWFEGVSKMFQVCFKGVLRVFHVCDLRVFQWSFEGVLRVFQ